MRIFTRGDLDGFASSVLLTTTESVKEIMFVHPKDAQDGRFEATSDDILVNLPYVQGCGLWFDHHISEEKKLKDIKGFKGAYAVAPSAARVVFNYYRSPKLDAYKDMLHDIDRFDSGQLTTEDVIDPKGWILLGYTLDPRSGLGPEFQKYFRWLVEYVKEVPLDKVLEHREVKKRIDKLRAEQAEFTQILKEHAKQDGNVILTDLRHLNNVPTGNRFLVYTMFPTANVEVRIFWGKAKQNVVIACGHSIFNRTCKSNMGRMLAEYGGGGHTGAGTCQVPVEKSEQTIKEIIQRLKEI
jgi:hypothetical protein